MNMRNVRKQKKQNGFSLIELMLVLVVIALLVFGAYVLFGTTQEGARSDQAQKDLLGLTAGAKRVCNRPGQCTTLTEANLITAGQAPKDMVNGTALQSPWGGAVTLVVGDLGTGTNNAFVTTFNGVPRAECNTFVSAVQNNFGKIVIGGTSVKDVGTAYDSAAAITACDNDANTLVFTSA